MIQTTIRGVRLATILLIGYWGLLFVATHLPKAPGIHVQHADKLAHFIAYAGLALLLAWALPTNPRYRLLNILLAGILAIGYGVFDECSQIPVGRVADLYDWVADSVGTAIGLIVYSFLRWRWTMRGRSQPTRSTTTLEALQA